MAEKKAETSTDRRGFLARIAMGTGLVASYGTGLVYGLQFLIPGKKKERFREMLVASMSELPVGGSKVFKDLSGREMILVNSEKGLKALSTTCTHLGCKTYWEPDKDRFYCPCHEAVFDTEGNVVSGPPPRPLDSYDVKVDENNNVYVFVKET